MTTSDTETTQTPTNQTIELSELVGAEITTFDNVGMSALHRCDVCGAQAYVEAEVFDTGAAHLNFGLRALRPGDTAKRILLFCAHHFNKSEGGLMAQAVRIIDHRPFLKVQEGRFKGQS